LSTIFACDELQMIHSREHGHGCIGLGSSQGKMSSFLSHHHRMDQSEDVLVWLL
jgi:hypothetical protein